MDNLSTENIAHGFDEAKKITRVYAKTFYFASLFLPKEKQAGAYSVYALCRNCDNSVDETPLEQSNQALLQVKEKLEAAYGSKGLKDTLLAAFRQTVKKYDIPKQYFDELIKGMELDLKKTRYADFPELYDYCYKVAGIVGLIMVKIFGYRKEEALLYAEKLGIAMQLTNILRDIQEDFSLGRIYLPEDELKNYGLNEKFLSQGQVTENFKNFMNFQIHRARDYYAQAGRGIPLITDKRSRFVVCAMKDIYGAILNAIEKNEYDVFRKRAHVPFSEKIFQLIGILLKNEYR